MIERLKRREAGIGDGRISPVGADKVTSGSMISFKEVLQKTIGEY